jgi:lipoprotein-anchoring transpeptidase ErfK/SrfK
MPRHSWRGRARIVTALMATGLAATMLAGCNGGDDKASAGKKDDGLGGGKPVPAATVAITPTTGSGKVSPGDPVVVKATGGTLSAVSLTNAAGKQVSGTLSGDKKTWTSSEKLGYDKKYAVSATATNPDGKKAAAKSSFTTVKPGNFTLPYLQNGNGKTYGVGEPIMVHFDEKIPDKAAAEKALKVTTSPAIEGSWSWINDQDVHWRPKTEAGKYWPAGTKVTLHADVYGVNMGKGLWGQEDRKTSFTIGDQIIAKASNKSLHMKVYKNGSMIRDMPFSGGKGGYIQDKYGNNVSLWTPSGTMVVMDTERKVHMTSSSWGIAKNNPQAYDLWVDYGTRLTGDGIYLHAAPWNVGLHGVRNDSHGCFNLSDADAEWAYSHLRPGDIVIMSGTPDKVTLTRGYGDWNVSWDQWVKGSALN